MQLLKAVRFPILTSMARPLARHLCNPIAIALICLSVCWPVGNGARRPSTSCAAIFPIKTKPERHQCDEPIARMTEKRLNIKCDQGSWRSRVRADDYEECVGY